ncbi:MAG: glycosidase [candidate division WOR-3 bacterium]
MSGDRQVLLQRYEKNPVLTAADWPYPVNTVFNPGAMLLPDGTTLLLCRVEDRSGISHLCAARSDNGVDNWHIDPVPTFLPDPLNHPEEIWGIEDPRITYIEELKKYAVTYTAYSRAGPAVALALTEDFRNFERLGVVMPPADKDAALLPRRFNGYWLMIHRPTTSLGAHIYISQSPDLIHWGRHHLVLPARRGAWWDASRVGLAAPPIETENGWLMFYHGVKETPSGSIYRVGLALLDRERPWRCVQRGTEWIFGPVMPYERVGDVNSVVFPCGSVLEPDGETIRVYYGAADTSICLARGRLSELLKWLEDHSVSTCEATSEPMIT